MLATPLARLPRGALVYLYGTRRMEKWFDNFSAPRRIGGVDDYIFGAVLIDYHALLYNDN